MGARDGLELERTGEFSNRELFRLLWPFFRPQRRHFLGAFFLLVLSSLLTIAGPLLIRHAIDIDIGGSDYPGLQRTVALYCALQIVALVTIYVMRNWLEWTGQNIMADLRKNLFSHLLDLPLPFHDQHTPGQLLSRIESDTQALRMLFTTTGVILLGDVLLFVGMFVAMGVVSPRLMLVMAFLLPCLVGLTLVFQRRIHPIFIDVRKQNSEVSGRLTELLQSTPVISAFARERWALRDFFELNRKKYGKQLEGEWLIILWFNLLELLEITAFALILGLGGYWALNGVGAVTIGTLAMFMGYVRRFFQPLLRLSEQVAVIQKALAAAERIFGLLREENSIQDTAAPLPWPGLKNHVRFENVSFRYQEEGNWILDNVSFTLPAGESWALVGPTGSGKTTIVSLLLRFYEPQQGRILIDDIDIRDLEQHDLRRQIALVLQDIHLFPGDLEANLTLGLPFHQSEIEQATAMTMADRFISQLPGGYHADLSERGSNLSTGQRQLLSFSRALLRNPPLLILDEATSAVDPATEAAIAEATRRVLAEKTSLVIAHRLSTIRHCSRILVLRQGKIIEQGTHEALLANAGLYRDLHDLQFREALCED